MIGSGLWSWIGRRIGLGSPFQKVWSAFGGAADNDEPVTVARSMRVSALMRGVRLYATTEGTLPLNVYEQPPRGGDPILVRDPSNMYDQILRISPNEDQTTTEFWEAIVGAKKLVGNGYARKHRIGNRLVSLELLDPNCCEPFRDENFRLRYRGTDQRNELFNLPASEVFHLKGFSFGGDMGMSIVQAGANSIGNVISANRASGKLLRSGLSSSGFLETGQVLNEEDRERLTKIMSDYAGSDNAGKLMILEGGMKYNQLSLSANDGALLGQIGFGIEEIARWLDMPPIMLGHNAAGQTMWGSGVESIVGTWYTLGLRAELTSTEKAINKRLIEPEHRGRFFVKFNVDGLLRGDSAAQAALFSAATQNGWLTRNEVRKLLDLPPLPGGDDLTVQVNMTLLKDLGSQNQNTAAQARNALLLLLGITPEMLEDRRNAPARPRAPEPAE